MTPDPAPANTVSIARFTHLFAVDVAEQMDVGWERVLSWLETRPTQRWDERCPGWSPVVYDPPRRAKENIQRVYALVLDYDKAATWDGVVSLWVDFYGLVYTTKSHHVGAHRLRVVLPLSRPVSADEYARLWQFADRRSRQAELPPDGQAKDASRFWYAPTLPDGDAWRSLRLTGALLDVDATLALVDTPPLRVVNAPRVITTDQRVERARRYLAKIPGAVAGSGGHTQTFNAVAHTMIGFDLDTDTTLLIVSQEYNLRCSPPWSERELLHKIRSVAERCTRERGYLLQERRPIATTRDAAQRAQPVDAELNVDWRAMLLVGDKNKIKRGYHNVLTFVRHHPDYRGRWSLNTMTGAMYFDDACMPETFVHTIRARIDEVLGFSPGREDVEAAILTSAQDRPFHPIQQYLRSVDWDGTGRLDSVARDYFGSDNPLHAQMARKWMISAVARALNPGCKVDTALMLYGEQGFYKSSFFAILGGDWHADSPIDITNKDSFAQIHAAWVYEFAELENVVHGRAESRLKAWLTSTHDMYRAPYARTVERRPRSCVICGTTNRRQFLTDDTGSRRFWIIPVAAPIDRDQLAHARDQLWAEAVAAYESGESWWLERGQDAEREQLNAEFAHDDPWQEVIALWLARPGVYEVTIGELLRDAIQLDVSRHDHMAHVRVGRILSALGWSYRVVRHGRRRARVYRLDQVDQLSGSDSDPF